MSRISYLGKGSRDSGRALFTRRKSGGLTGKEIGVLSREEIPPFSGIL